MLYDDSDQVENAVCEAKKIVQRVNNFENVFNINEGTTQLIHYEPYRAHAMLSKLQDLIEPEL